MADSVRETDADESEPVLPAKEPLAPPTESKFARGKLASHLVAATISIAVGVLLVWCNWRNASPDYLLQFTYGNRDVVPTVAGIQAAVGADTLVILGYVLVLGACASVFRRLAFSESGKVLGKTLGYTVGALAVADLIENALLFWSLNPPRLPGLPYLSESFWRDAPAVAATVKWCVALIAVGAIPIAMFSVGRFLMGQFRRWRYTRRAAGNEWWDDVLAPALQNPERPGGSAQAAWRKAYELPPRIGAVDTESDSARTALCLSGGGVRSACVAMGAMQSFSTPVKPKSATVPPTVFARGTSPIDQVDYVISVSGGGYSAGARLLGVQPGGGTAEPPTAPHLSDRFDPGSPEFDFLRRRSSYIADTPARLVAALAQVLRNLVASLILVFVVPVMVGWTLGWLLAKFPLAAFFPLREQTGDASNAVRTFIAAAAIGTPVLLAVCCVAIGLLLEATSAKPWATAAKEWCSILGRVFTLLAVLVFAVTVALPGLMWLCSPMTVDGKGRVAGAVAGLAGVVVLQYGATLVSILSGKKKDGVPKADTSKLKKLIPPGIIQLALVVLTLVVLLAAWLFVMAIVAAHVFSAVRRNVEYVTSVPHLALILVALAVLAGLMSIVDVTSLSLHPFYRRRLARTFAVRRDGEVAKGYDPKEPTWLYDYGHAEDVKPQFVFAAAAAMSDDDVRPAPGLGSVSFVFTADYVGGPALGWMHTKKLCLAAAPRIKRDLTVQAAMAVSGAAFASAMGRQSKGFQTLLALSGARLGTWLPNPRFVKNAKDNAADPAFPKALPWVRGAGYFYRELMGINKSDARLAQITDGGHYENLGLVEALRRKCSLIYCVDASGDTPPLLSGLDDAIRLAKFELGVEITFDHGGDFGVEELAPGSGEEFPNGHAFHSLNGRVTEDAVLRARIQYPQAAGLGTGPASRGTLIVAKAVLWRKLPEWVLTYGAGASGEAFPNDSTSDQWFSEAQFAAYTEVGRRIGVRALEVPELADPEESNGSATRRPSSNPGARSSGW